MARLRRHGSAFPLSRCIAPLFFGCAPKGAAVTSGQDDPCGRSPPWR